MTENGSTGSARPGRGRLILTIAIVVVVAAAAWLVTTLVLRSTDAPPTDAASSQAPTGEPVPFSSPELGFSAEFPATPATSSADQSVNGVTVTVDTVQWAAGVAAAAVSVSDLSKIISEQDADTVLDGSIEGMATGTSGTLSDKQFITLDGERAISGTITAGTAKLKAIVAVKEGVQYILVSTGQSDADAEAFFSSFAFVE